VSRKGERRKAARAGGRAAGSSGAGRDAQAPQAPGLARRAWDQIGPLAIAVIIALGIRAMIIESYYVPSESMLPTLLIGDHVFVNKFVFGAHVPFTGWTLPALRDPERGEIVVFALGRRGPGRICPLDECPDYPAEGFVKRIVGLPGDRVEYRDGVLYINGRAVRSDDTGERFSDEHHREYRVMREHLGDCVHETLDHPQLSGLSNPPFTIPAGRYYMLGDNRDNSNDSRAWGTVRREELKGPVLVTYWSWNNQESWLAMLNPYTWVRLLWSETRWDRIGRTDACEHEGASEGRTG
jgi:signal peptidase I